MREVSLDPNTALRLQARLATEPAVALLFPAANGAPIDRSRLYRVVRGAGRRAGIEWPVGLHTLRHTAASTMWRRGTNREQIRRVLGHQSWDFTDSTYIHLQDADIPDGSVLGDLVGRNARETEFPRGPI